MKKVVKINENDLRSMIAESIERVLGGEEESKADIGKELQLFLNDMKYSLFKKGESSSPTKRDYMIAKHFYELGKKGETLNEGGGYDMSTPEGRAGAEDWMHQIISQEDPVSNAADQWVSDNAPEYPDISWDDCYERMKEAFIAGVEYGRNL